jgi:hypothetical protein
MYEHESIFRTVCLTLQVQIFYIVFQHRTLLPDVLWTIVAQNSSFPQKESFRLTDTPRMHRFLQLLVRFLPIALRLCDHIWPINPFVDTSAATQHCSHNALEPCYAFKHLVQLQLIKNGSMFTALLSYKWKWGVHARHSLQKCTMKVKPASQCWGGGGGALWTWEYTL